MSNFVYPASESGSKKAERRSSSAATSSLSTSNSKENKRPLTAVMSEDGSLTSTKTDKPTSSCIPPVSEPTARHSYLSKLTRMESGKSGNAQQLNQPAQPKKAEPTQARMVTTASISDQSAYPSAILHLSTPSTSTNVHGKECDNLTTSTGRSSAASNSYKSDEDKKGSNILSNDDLKKRKSYECKDKKIENSELDITIEDDDEDNQVIPLWPSKSEAINRNTSDFVQHKVYSLKDYSQVASPTTTSQQPASSSLMINSASGNSKTLLKSMSQDRKTKTNFKRLSDCSYSDPRASIINTSAGRATSAAATSLASTKQLDPSALTVGPSASFSLGSGGGSVVSLLPPNTRHAALMSESRIDRVRKLFVSPLSLRSGNSKSGSNAAQASSNPRLSFQSGANMLNKPHYLMHAMYRTGASGAHHSRRSPLRPKQGKTFRVYGCPLQMANNIYPITCFGRADIYKQQSVPYILARLCNYIEENSSHLTHEGIFRVSGNARLMEKLRTLFDRLGDAPLESESVDVATSASLLKMYLRELPEPLIPTRMNYCFIALAKKYSPFLSKDNVSSYSSSLNLGSSGSGSRIGSLASPSVTSITEQSSTNNMSENQAIAERQRLAFSRDLTKLLRKLPIENYNLLKYLACFLFRISLKQQYNKMCAEALGIVFGPNVFRIRSESYKGLKEQELSNQIMASIISNYRCIFDSELTDPLGNLVSSEGDSMHKTSSDSDKTNLNQTIVSSIVNMKSPSPILSTSTTLDASSSMDFGSMDASGSCSGITVVPTMIPSTSQTLAETTSKLSRDKGDSCCREHCQNYLFDGDLDEDEDEGDVKDTDEGSGSETQGLDHDVDSIDDEPDEDDYDDDECDDEGESYTPSSSSGSYCSSMDSETLESSYDEEVQGGDGENVDIGSRSNVSSSECASNTSYTPTSSHTDSELHEEDIEGSFYGNSSSFGSSPSSNRATKQQTKFKSKHASNSSQPPSCIVCKRRESAQLETSIQSGLGDKRGNSNCDKDSRLVETLEETSEIAKKSVNIPVLQMETQKDEGLNEDQSKSINNEETKQEATSSEIAQQLHLPSARSSSRRRRTESTKKHAHLTAQSNSSITSKSDQASPTPSTSIGGVENTTAVPNASDSSKRNLHPSSRVRAHETQNKNRHSGAKGQHAARVDFFRRRSSSASSLNRIKHKREQIAATTHKKVPRLEEPQHSRSKVVYQTDLKQQRKIQEIRAHNSARRSRGKSHLLRKVADADSTNPIENTSSSSRTMRPSSVRYRGDNSKSGTRSHNRHKMDNYYYYDPIVFDKVSGLRNAPNSKLVGHSLGGVEIDVEACDFLSAQYLAEEIEYTDRYFLLRPFNSDETLLRSLNYNSEFQIEPTGLSRRRRFSGHEFDKVDLVQVCEPTRNCNQIFEGLEEEVRSVVLGSLGEHNSTLQTAKDFIDSSNSTKIIDKPGTSKAADGMFQTSFVSLLDNRMPGFGRSELSINYDSNIQCQVDPILIQMKSIKKLLKVFKKQLKLELYLTYPQEVRRTLLNSISVCGASLDDYSTSHIDYLTAESFIEYLERNTASSNEMTTASISTEVRCSLRELLQSKITLHQRHYNDLKNIRDHYLKNHNFKVIQHTSQKNQNNDTSRKLSETTVVTSQESLMGKSKIHGSLDTLRQRNSNIAINIARRQRKLSVPTQEVPEDDDYKKETIENSFHDSSKNVSTIEEKRDSSLECQSLSQNSCEPQERANCLQDSSPASSTTFVTRPIVSCKFGTFCPVEFVFNIEKQLALKRSQGCRLVKLNDMNIEQLQSEKLELQKNLLRYEHWYGRPITPLEYSLVGHLYERYRAVKIIRGLKQPTQHREQKETPVASAGDETTTQD